MHIFKTANIIKKLITASEHKHISDNAEKNATNGWHTTTRGQWLHREYPVKPVVMTYGTLLDKYGNKQLSVGTRVYVEHTMPDKKWVKIMCREKTGYLEQQYLKKEKPSGKPAIINFQQQDGMVERTYGDICALAGLYPDYETLTNAPAKELMQIKNIIKQQNSIDWKQHIPEWKELCLLTINNRPALTQTNTVAAWKHYHEKALTAACIAKSEKDTEQKNKHQEQALAMNAFAENYLSDLFAAGSLIDAGEIMRSAQKNLAKLNKNELDIFFMHIAQQVWDARFHIVTMCNIDTMGSLKQILMSEYQQQPVMLLTGLTDYIKNIFVEKGIVVENSHGVRWQLGDRQSSLAKSAEMCNNAIITARHNLQTVTRLSECDRLISRVESFLPSKITDSKEYSWARELVALLSDPHKEMINALADNVRNYFGIVELSLTCSA